MFVNLCIQIILWIILYLIQTIFVGKKSHLNYRQLLKTNQVTQKWYDCPLNYISCGILDSLGRQLNIKNDEPCTINNITIQNLFHNNTMNFNEESKFFMYNINNNTAIQLISIIKLSQYRLCINPSEKDYHYPLELPDQRFKTEIKCNI